MLHMLMWSTSTTSQTRVRFTSTIGGHLFGLHVLEAGREFSLEGKAADGVLYVAYINFLLLIFS